MSCDVMVSIDKMDFGWIIVNGRKHRHDIVIFPDGTVKRRRGGFLMFGSHTFKLKEFEELCRHEMDALVVGRGTDDIAKIAEDARSFIESKKITLFEGASEEAIQKFNALVKNGKVVGAIIHVTC